MCKIRLKFYISNVLTLLDSILVIIILFLASSKSTDILFLNSLLFIYFVCPYAFREILYTFENPEDNLWRLSFQCIVVIFWVVHCYSLCTMDFPRTTLLQCVSHFCWLSAIDTHRTWLRCSIPSKQDARCVLKIILQTSLIMTKAFST